MTKVSGEMHKSSYALKVCGSDESDVIKGEVKTVKWR